MDEWKVSFIICTNDRQYEDECSHYIRNLMIPKGFKIEILPVRGASSMASGYNQAMRQSNAKYKVYLHQDTFIINSFFLEKVINIFKGEPQIGMLGVVGSKKLPANGCMWANHMRTGTVRSYILEQYDDYFDIPLSNKREYSPVQVLDGLLLVTQYDIDWREEIFDGWDFYDISQCFEFKRRGYRIGVLSTEEPWILHDCGFMNLEKYHIYRRKFLEEYMPENKVEIEKCVLYHEKFYENKMRIEKRAQSRKDQIYKKMRLGQYIEAQDILYTFLDANKEDEEYCILMLLFKIYQLEIENGESQNIFSYWKKNELSVNWLYRQYHCICHMIWREKYHLPIKLCDQGKEYLEKTEVTELAQSLLGNCL